MPVHRFPVSELEECVTCLEGDGQRVVCLARDGDEWVVITEQMILLEPDFVDEYR